MSQRKKSMAVLLDIQKKSLYGQLTDEQMQQEVRPMH
jgi:hypothetical protein